MSNVIFNVFSKFFPLPSYGIVIFLYQYFLISNALSADWSKMYIFQPDSVSSTNNFPIIHINPANELHIAYSVRSNNNSILYFIRSSDAGRSFSDPIIVEEFPQNSFGLGRIPFIIDYEANSTFSIYYLFHDEYNFFIRAKISTNNGQTFISTPLNLSNGGFSPGFHSVSSEIKFMFHTDLYGQLLLRKDSFSGFRYIDSLQIKTENLDIDLNDNFTVVQNSLNEIIVFWRAKKEGNDSRNLFYNFVNNFNDVTSPICLDTSIINPITKSIAIHDHNIYISILGQIGDQILLLFKRSLNEGNSFESAQLLFEYPSSMMYGIMSPLYYDSRFGLILVLNKYNRGLAIWRSKDDGKSFTELTAMDDGFDYQMWVNSVAVDSSRNVFMAAYERKSGSLVLFRSDILLTALPKEKETSSIKIEIFPNPFNISCNILITTEVPRQFTVDIYNIQGQRISRLYNGLITSTTTLEWNPSEQNKFQTASGIYLIKLRSSNFIEIRKLLLIK